MAVQMFFTILFLSILSSTFSDSSPFNLTYWCNQTPNPKLCQYFMAQNPQLSLGINPKTEFPKLAINTALDQALLAQKNVMWHGANAQNDGERAAWADCIELYQNTISRLNSTISHYGEYSDLDVQTWLSTSLTNIETCRTSSVELGISDRILESIVSNNVVSKLISNALAINKLITPPTRVSYVGEQKMLVGDCNLTSRANLVVAQDGSGDFKTIQEAVHAASKREGKERFVIHVKEGVYDEIVEISHKVKNVMMIGDGIGRTIVTGSKSVSRGFSTFNSATFAVKGDGFIARDLTFRNTAGPTNGQAVALLSKSDLSVFYRCSFEGYQDTLYVHSSRQFYRECDIYGTVDFIFGNALSMFQNCNIYYRGNMNTITAQSRSDRNQTTGIVIHNSKVLKAADSVVVQNSGIKTRTYLGRPWREYARTVFLTTYLDSSIDPAGWLEWNAAPDSVYYGEYDNTGPGCSTEKRVNWGGFHVISSISDAEKFSVGNFLGGDSWLPSTNVPFNSGL